MTEFFRTSTLWVVDFRYQGRARRWFKAFGANEDAQRAMLAALRDLYGDRARLVAVRRATADEEAQYLRGETPVNAYCRTGR
ncbi:MAG TPA: hypothetical protein PKC97_01145 [Burkholderiaceae bacterium]|jgi:uncharacterized DUF497 family protein|nr:hypothetical protein [Burkholderiaceae bacterium]